MNEKIMVFIADVCHFVFSKFPVKNTIVFESNPEFTCNTYALYRYLIDEKHIDDRYNIIWLVNNKNDYKDVNLKNTQFINFLKNTKSIKDKFRYHYIISTAKALIYGNRLLGKYRKNQLSVCLQHGMPLKKSNGAYCINNKCDIALCVSEFFKDSYENDFVVSSDKMIFTGFPRNDYLFTKRDTIGELGFGKYEKIIIWMPTYRKHNHDAMKGFNIEGSSTGIPALNTTQEIKKVDKWLCDNNCLLLFKPHPVQGIEKKIQSELTNLKIIDNDWLKEKNMQLYELLGKTDALVTDYSSVYYDYLLTDNPIGLTVDDLEDYIASRGFVFDNPKDILKGVYIKDNNELISFLQDVKDGKDEFKEKRNELKNKMHKIQSDDSARLTAEEILSRLEG